MNERSFSIRIEGQILLSFLLALTLLSSCTQIVPTPVPAPGPTDTPAPGPLPTPVPATPSPPVPGLAPPMVFLATPVVYTDNVTTVTSTSAVLNGTLSDLSTSPNVNVSFQWGLSSGYYTSETNIESKSSPGAFSFNLSGLNPATVYYFRARASNINGTGYGNERTFTTNALSSISPGPVLQFNEEPIPGN